MSNEHLLHLDMQVFKFLCYLSIPAGTTYFIAGKPEVLEAIIKNVSSPYVNRNKITKAAVNIFVTFSKSDNQKVSLLCRGPT